MMIKRMQYIIPAIFVLMALFMVSVAGTLAQDGEVIVEPIEIDGATVYMVNDIVVIGVMFIILALLSLVGASIAALWKSAPGWIGDLILPVIDGALKIGDDIAGRTITPIDNGLMEAIRIVIKEELEPKTGAAGIAQSIKVLDDHIFSVIKETPDGPLSAIMEAVPDSIVTAVRDAGIGDA